MANIAPTRKVSAGILAGAIVAVAAWASKSYAQVEIPTEIGMAITTIVTFVVQWTVPDAEDEPAPQ